MKTTYYSARHEERLTAMAGKRAKSQLVSALLCFLGLTVVFGIWFAVASAAILGGQL